jgi:dCMP deaminase
MSRISWDEYFMNMAELASRRSTCLRRQVGAVIVKDNQVLATGYNGAPKGIPNCCDLNECLREKLHIPSGERHELCRAVHAENNAITQCAVNGVSCKGGTMYVTASPCNMCLKQIINAGIVKIIAKEVYPDEMSKEMLKQSGIDFELYNKDEE